jgi:hypothetical protein
VFISIVSSRGVTGSNCSRIAPLTASPVVEKRTCLEQPRPSPVESLPQTFDYSLFLLYDRATPRLPVTRYAVCIGPAAVYRLSTVILQYPSTLLAPRSACPPWLAILLSFCSRCFLLPWLWRPRVNLAVILETSVLNRRHAVLVSNTYSFLLSKAV